MTSWLLLLALAGAPSQDGFMIILGGGKTDQDAEQVQKKWLAGAGERERYLRAAPGWPKVVASGSVSGLKPGLKVSVLGVCPPGKAAEVQWSVSSWRGAYVRKVKWDSPMACPGFTSSLKIEAVGEVNGEGRTLRVSKASVLPVLELLDAKGEVLEIRGADFGEAQKLTNLAKVEVDAWAELVGIPEGVVEMKVSFTAKCRRAFVTQLTRLEGSKLVNSFELHHEEVTCDSPH